MHLSSLGNIQCLFAVRWLFTWLFIAVKSISLQIARFAFHLHIYIIYFISSLYFITPYWNGLCREWVLNKRPNIWYKFFFWSNSLGTKIVLFIYKYSHFIKCVYIILKYVRSSKYNYRLKQRKFISILANRNFAM